MSSIKDSLQEQESIPSGNSNTRQILNGSGLHSPPSSDVGLPDDEKDSNTKQDAKGLESNHNGLNKAKETKEEEEHKENNPENLIDATKSNEEAKDSQPRFVSLACTHFHPAHT